MLESEAFCSAFITLGYEVPDDILPDVNKFVCTMYEQKDYAGVNATRYNLFRLTCRLRLFPLIRTVENTTLQWQITRLQFIVAPLNGSLLRLSAVGHGWQVEDGQLV